MSMETANLCSLLLPATVVAEHEEVLAADYERYLSGLTAMSLVRLSRESGTLAHEKEATDKALFDLAVRNYVSFIDSAQCLAAIYKDFTDVSERVGGLLSRLPQLATRQREFAQQSLTVLDQKATNKIILDHQHQLEHLLDAPQLMDALVRTEAYDEALELVAFVHSLSRRLGSIPIVQSIVADVQHSTLRMLAQIEAALQGDVATPVCIRLVGCLRRLDMFSPLELRLLFLQSREIRLAEQLEAISGAETPAKAILEHLNILRMHTLSVVTQYRTVFPEEAAAHETDAAAAVALPTAGLYHSWVAALVSGLLRFLTERLAAVTDGVSLAAIATRAMQFAASLARVQLDVRGLLPPVFEARALSLFGASLDKAVADFAARLPRYDWAADDAGPAAAASDADLAAAAAAAGAALSGTVPASRTAPQALLRWPLLALLADAYVEALNELREFAPLAVAGRAATLLADSLHAWARACDAATVDGKLSAEGARRLRRLREGAADVLLPFMARALDYIFGAAAPLLSGERTAALAARMRKG